MKDFKKINLFLITCLLLYGCQKVSSDYYEYNNQVAEFSGNIVEYLRDQGYDSMVLVINRIPGMIDSLAEDNLTVFAVSNESFNHALNSLNTSLLAKKKPALSLATIDEHILDTLVSSYIFKGYFSADTVSLFENGIKAKSLKFDYVMDFQYERSGSSGYANGGTQSIILSDMNNSSLETNWQNAQTKAVNLKLLNHCLIHELSSNHEFGFSKLASKVNNQLDENDNK